MTACWLAQFGLIETPTGLVPAHLHPTLGKCDGPMDPAHLIPKQLLRRELGSRWVGFEEIVVPGCRRHHDLMDTARRLKIPRDALPESVERFADAHGLAWWLEREYRDLEAAA